MDKPALNGTHTAPVRPAEPEASDCCGDGCARCVFDVYEEALDAYQIALAAWRARQA